MATPAEDDPFLSTPTHNRHSHRFSAINTQLFTLGSSGSPTQARRALEAHLEETERRIQDASTLGTTLVKQRGELMDRLKEVKQQHSEAEIGPELRQKLVNLEREYDEVGRESARAFLGPKGRTVSVERGPNGETLSSQATASPSKVSVPSRKQRNQPNNRVHDIEFATEISTSLLAQVRNLQALLAEKDESLKSVELEKSRLEVEAEGFAQRLRSLTESEQRYKDENWSLETQIHELMASSKESADREEKLVQTLAASNAEKLSAQRELDELKQHVGKTNEDFASVKKFHEIELATMRRTITVADNDRALMQRKIEELNSQNQELAKAVAGRYRDDEHSPVRAPRVEDIDMPEENITPESSPPPSPTKGTPRHSMLESETLKSSLHHAHRMIQNLKSNIHREKTEKVELKRMLQEARDELELRRGEGGVGSANNTAKRRKAGNQQDPFKKPLKPGRLGSGRTSTTEIMVDDANWEDHDDDETRAMPGAFGGENSDTPTRGGDNIESANETSDAFETANEREGTTTETDAFQTGAESLAGDSSDDLTETESRPTKGGTIRSSQTARQSINTPGNRTSYMSTASTSGDEDEEASLKMQTPIQQQARYRLKMTRARRSRMGAEAGGVGSNQSSAKNSPASFISTSGQFGQGGQSLFTELDDLEGEFGEGNSVDGTPSRTSVVSPASTANLPPRDVERMERPVSVLPPMVDSGMMTEPWEPAPVPVELPQAPSEVEPREVPVVVPLPVSRSERRDERLEPLGLSSISSQTTEPIEVVSPEIVRNAPIRPAPFTFAPIQAQTTEPIALPEPVASVPTSTAVQTGEEEGDLRPDSQDEIQAAAPGFLSSVFGWNKSKSRAEPQIAEDETSQDVNEASIKDDRQQTPFKDISGNVVHRAPQDSENIGVASKPLPKVEMADQSSQTMLSSDAIENLMNKELFVAPVDTKAVDRAPRDLTISVLPNSQSQRAIRSSGSQDIGDADRRTSLTKDEPPFTKSHVRSGSASSFRSSTQAHPPLPADHKQVIAAAAQRASSSDAKSTSMGPPLVPASAYRSSTPVLRPRTPNSVYQSPPKSGTTPRARPSSRSGVSSPVGTRRSSVSSFASELDQRFNIRYEGMPMPHGFESGADPRMIQAITQTMIGEYLWKYTRKTGRGDMSNSRHRRFFWVHPYTRTLYWSDKDPSSAGRAELKAKSVAIEAVRVVTDDNPMPPGLHRKSLVIITPGRAVKFTATTGQRHETWFNALSYLLLRTGAEARTTEDQHITSEDVNEFNPGYGHRSSVKPPSLSSYNSRTTANSSPAQPVPNTSVRSSQQARGSDASKHRHSSISKLKNYWRPGSAMGDEPRASFSSRRSRRSARDASIYEASEVHDSAEDVRAVIKQQEAESDGLENVRACCDGKHDVGHLHHHQKGKARHGSQASRYSNVQFAVPDEEGRAK